MNQPDQEQMQKLLKKYLQNECTPEEARQVRLWYETLDLYSTDPEVEKDQKASLKAQLWLGIQDRTAEEAPTVLTAKPNRVRRLLSPFFQAGIAAAVLLALGWLLWQNREPSH